MEIKYPDVKVRLTEIDGNAFLILAEVRKALEKAGVPLRERDKFSIEARSGDYAHLLQTVMKWVNVS